jgi:HEAT repeat protein
MSSEYAGIEKSPGRFGQTSGVKSRRQPSRAPMRSGGSNTVDRACVGPVSVRPVGILDFVKRKSPVEKAQKQLCEPYNQPEYRRQAMDKLLEIGTEEAYDALLRRFTFVASGNIADEEEKSDLVDELVRVGKPAIEPIKRYLRREKQIAFPVRALARIVEKAELLTFLIETLGAYEPLDHRSTQQKTTLVMELGEFGGPEHASAIVPYLQDHHDDVQFQAIVSLEKFKNPETRASIAELCIGDTHSARIQRRAAQALADLEWSVKEYFDRMGAELKSEYLLGKKGQLVHKKTAEAKPS